MSLIPIVIDTREQRSWEFNPEQFSIVYAKLEAGDYSIAGLENLVAIERKSRGDFVNTVIHNWILFRKELIRLSGYACAAIVIESNIDQIMEHRYESEASPNSVLGRMNAIYVDHGIPCFLWGTPEQASHMAGRFLAMCWKRLS